VKYLEINNTTRVEPDVVSQHAKATQRAAALRCASVEDTAFRARSADEPVHKSEPLTRSEFAEATYSSEAQ